MQSFISFDFLSIFGAFQAFGWVIYLTLPIALFVVLANTFLYYNQAKFKKGIDWSLIEIRIPREILKGPKAMEHFFNILYGLRNGPSGFKEKYLDGEVTRWFTLEIATMSGRTRFFLRVPTKLKIAVESMLYGQYSDLEVFDGEDYTDLMPKTFEGLQQIGYELFMTEAALDKPSSYPINNYELFETKEGDERILDSMSMLMELLGRLSSDEVFWMQILLAPADGGWQDEGKALIKEIKAKEAALTKESGANLRTPGEELKTKMIEKKISRFGFKTLIRYAYMAPKPVFNSELASRGIFSYFSQFSNDMNVFKKNSKIEVKPAKGDPMEGAGKKNYMLKEYITRAMPEETFMGQYLTAGSVSLGGAHKLSILTSDELAAVFHPPTNVVLTAPVMERIESKRVSAPSNLPG